MPTRSLRRRIPAILGRQAGAAALSIAYTPPKGRPNNGQYIPLQLEYSAKDDKFRVFAAKVRHGRLRGYFSLNLNRITQIEPSPERYAGPLDVEAWRAEPAGAPSRYKFWSRTSATESNGLWWNSPPLEKQSEYDADTNAWSRQALVPEGRRDGGVDSPAGLWPGGARPGTRAFCPAAAGAD